jgi:TPR repeat protein
MIRLPSPSILIYTFWLICCGQAASQSDQKAPLTIYEVAGITIRLPSEPIKKSISLPEEARKLLKSYDTYNSLSKLATISIGHAVYQNPVANLTGAAKGTISEIRKLSNITAFREITTPVKPAGFAGREIKLSYERYGHTVIQYILIFVENDHLWQIQVIGVNAAKPPSLITLKDQIFNSVSLPEIDLTGIRQKAEAGNPSYQFTLGEAYRKGVGIVKDPKKAFEWHEKAAKQGSDAAQFRLGVFYETGKGTAKDSQKAAEWYEKAANQGHSTSQFNLGCLYDEGKGVAKDQKKAIEWFKKAAEQGDIDAQYNLANTPTKEGFEWALKAASQGDPEAQCLLANKYSSGTGTLTDKKKSFEWYQKAAQQGYAWGQRSVGLIYASGNGKVVTKDDKKAFQWMEKAANQGDLAAHLYLGEMYFNGAGTLKDAKKAKELIKKAYEGKGSASWYVNPAAKKFWDKNELWKY